MRLFKYIVSLGLLLALFSQKAGAQYQSVVCAGQTGVPYYVQGWENSSYNWTVEGGTIAEDYGDSIIVDWEVVPGEYEITLQEVSDQGCAGELKRALVLVSGPTLDLGGDFAICQGEVFELEPSGDFADYSWSDGSTGDRFSTTVEGWVKLHVSDEYGCEASDSLFLSVNDLPVVDLGPDTTICNDEGLVLDAGTQGSYLWSTGDIGQTILVYVDGMQEIWVEVENEYGCLGGDTILINECSVLYSLGIPTGITPNDDGVNDVWNISRIEHFPKMLVEVYDQWGTLVWRSEPGYPGPWDGRDRKGNLVPFDSYHFVIQINDGSKERIHGIITVMH